MLRRPGAADLPERSCARPLSRPDRGVGRRSPTQAVRPRNRGRRASRAPDGNQRDEPVGVGNGIGQRPLADRATGLDHRERGVERTVVSHCAGVMTTRRCGSSPSDRVAIPSTSLSTSWTILRSADDIGSSTRRHARLLHLVGDLQREPIERLLAALAVAGDVDPQPGVVIAEPALRGNSGQILDGLQGRAPSARPADRDPRRGRGSPRSSPSRSTRWYP